MKKLSIGIVLLLFFNSTAYSQIVRMETVLGNIDIELHPDVAPVTVANFLNYVNDGDYDNSYVHRVAANFIVQGGGFRFIEGEGTSVPTDSSIVNEYSLPNARGTIAMAKLSGQPDSATSQWFINTIDNTYNLGPDSPYNQESGGFTVFGTVISGMDVVDAMNNLSSANLYLPIDGSNYYFQDVPYLNSKPTVLAESDAVMITSVHVVEETFVINSGLNGTWFNPDTAGSGITLEILPQSKQAFMAWFTYDTAAPAEGVESTVGYAGQRWLSGFGSVDIQNNSVTFDLINTSGGLFDSSQPVENSAAESYGSMTIVFNTCNSADVSYTLYNQELTNTFTIGRISNENNSLCEGLYNQMTDGD